MRQFYFLFSFLLLASCSFAQTPEPGNIQIIKDARIDELLNQYHAINAEKASIQGYRIQVAAGANRSVVYNMKAKFYSAFPDIKNFVVYQQPNFKLRVGRYRTRLDAHKDLQDILPQFTDAFIIREEIKLEEFSE